MNPFRFLLIAVLFFASAVQAQSKHPAAVVEAQLQAYNGKNLDAFIELFHEEASLWALGAEQASAEGKDAIRELYERLFIASPALHSEVINRTVIGNRVIDYELITGRLGSDEALHLVMIYEVVDGKIMRAWSLR